VNEDTMAKIREAFSKANAKLSLVTCRNQAWKMTVFPFGWKSACMTKRKIVAGKINRNAALKYSRWTLPIKLKGTMINKIIRCGVQYQGDKKLINVNPNARKSLVSGLRL
jgi:hypothetical protein